MSSKDCLEITVLIQIRQTIKKRLHILLVNFEDANMFCKTIIHASKMLDQ